MQGKRLQWFLFYVCQPQQIQGALAKLHLYNCSFQPLMETRRDGNL